MFSNFNRNLKWLAETIYTVNLVFTYILFIY